MSEKEPPLIVFRLSPEEYGEAKRIATMASSHGKIPNDSVNTLNTLAKTSLFVRINDWKQIEFQHEAEKIERRSIEAARFTFSAV